ncbi:class I SAM-dependent methyltransferase [Niveispirillum fermenti]|uniref:class I SAM-dependent methyltransferase n=1 Tax=Niveispirillum fermenti TaxID=1233113 RepID=UPI003A85D8D9
MANGWSEGYMAETNYTHGFYRELSPSLLAVAALAANQTAPDPAKPLTYCELGCGQGVTVNLLAAANPDIQFYANDFNPSQIADAQALAAEAGTANIHFLNDSFAEMAARTDLPDFDIIVLHGIYSWISAENRRHIVAFIARRLKVGGLVYISYNTLPGWAVMLPLQRLLMDQPLGGDIPVLARIEQALKAAETLADGNARYFQANPGVAARMKQIRTQPRAYVAHEYFNRHWTPMYHADVVEDLAAIKLTWIATARPLDGIDNLQFTTEQLALLNNVENRTRREGLKDYILNQQFRRDLFVKGPIPLHGLRSETIWRETPFVLTVGEASLRDLKIATPMGELSASSSIFPPIIRHLATGPVTAGELAAALPQLSFGQICQTLTILASQDNAHPCVAPEKAAAAKPHTDRFNRAVLARARFSADIGVLASPLTGGGFLMDQMTQMLFSAHLAGVDAVASVWSHMRASNQRFSQDGQMIVEEEANIAELRRRDATFTNETWPVLKRLQIV